MFGICNLSIVPVRFEPNDRSEQVTQLLFGDTFEIIEKAGNWIQIVINFDKYLGWIDAKQCEFISEKTFENINQQEPIYCNDTTFTLNKNILITKGASLNYLKKEAYSDLSIIKGLQPKHKLIETAYDYLNSPYLWGGKSPFGIDCSGFTQMVFKINGYQIPRDASQQALLGTTLSFIEECEPGDLAFFDNKDGNITHVGIILKDNFIIHASGKVRIDRIDHNGIYNSDLKKHTHLLRVLKKII